MTVILAEKVIDTYSRRLSKGMAGKWKARFVGRTDDD
jgi:hypothetical protein